VPTNVSRTRTIAAAPQAVWDVLSDFGAIGTWVDGVDHSCLLRHRDDGGLVGVARRIQMGRTTLVEEIVDAEPPSGLAYDILGLPRVLGRLRNRWRLETAAPASTEVVLTSSVDIGQGPLRKLAERVVCRVIARQSDRMLAGLAKRLEKVNV
jgi:carbon monoxide dehydrogenase subunit G